MAVRSDRSRSAEPPHAARRAAGTAPATAARRTRSPAKSEPRFEIDRRIVLRIVLVLIVFAFFAVFVRVASMGFRASVHGVDKVDRDMAPVTKAVPAESK